MEIKILKKAFSFERLFLYEYNFKTYDLKFETLYVLPSPVA